jgi:hypothetical protein
MVRVATDPQRKGSPQTQGSAVARTPASRPPYSLERASREIFISPLRPVVALPVAARLFSISLMTARPVHMVRATVCGRARRGDSFTADWQAVRCSDCDIRRPVARSNCLHCHRPIPGSCAHIHRLNAWLHADCIPAFERSPLGRHLKAFFLNLYGSPKCPRCGRPGEDHGPGCKGGR